jgi:hypothetical protein
MGLGRRVAPNLADGAQHRKELLRIGDIVNPDDVGAPLDGYSQGGQGAYIPFSRGQASQEMTQKGFARRTDEQGAAEIQEGIQVV